MSKRFPVDEQPAFALARSPEGVSQVEVRCSSCDATARRNAEPNIRPQVVARWFRQIGWDVQGEGKSATCPNCNRKPEPLPNVAMQSREALRQQRLLYQLLDHHFDAELGTYDEGFSDQEIADRTGFAIGYVIEAREAAYGALVDQELEAFGELLREQAQAFTQERRDLRAELKKLEAELELTTERTEALLAKREHELAELHKQLSTLKRK